MCGHRLAATAALDAESAIRWHARCSTSSHAGHRNRARSHQAAHARGVLRTTASSRPSITSKVAAAIKLAKDDDGQHHYIPLDWVTSVDDKVHVDRPGKQAMQRMDNHSAQAVGGAMSGVMSGKLENSVDATRGQPLAMRVLARKDELEDALAELGPHDALVRQAIETALATVYSADDRRPRASVATSSPAISTAGSSATSTSARRLRAASKPRGSHSCTRPSADAQSTSVLATVTARAVV